MSARVPMRWRIALPFAIVLLATLATLSLLISSRVHSVRLADYEARLLSESSLIEPLVAGVAANVDLRPLAQQWAADADARVTLIAADGTVLADSERDAATMDNHAGRPEVLQALASGTGRAVRFSDTMRYQVLYLARRMDASGGEVAVVRLAMPLAEVEAETASLRRFVLGAAMVAMLLVLALSYIVGDRITRPLRALALEVRQRPPVDEGLQSGGYDEVQQLALAFNAMTHQLHSQMDGLAEERNKIQLGKHQLCLVALLGQGRHLLTQAPRHAVEGAGERLHFIVATLL